MERNGKNGTARPDPTRALETLLEHVAAESVDPGDADRENAWVHGLQQKIDTQLAALRRQHMPARPLPRQAAPISDELLALSREGLLARLEILRQASDVRVAHLELSGLTTDDLRQLLAEVEAIERTST